MAGFGVNAISLSCESGGSSTQQGSVLRQGQVRIEKAILTPLGTRPPPLLDRGEGRGANCAQGSLPKKACALGDSDCPSSSSATALCGAHQHPKRGKEAPFTERRNRGQRAEGVWGGRGGGREGRSDAERRRWAAKNGPPKMGPPGAREARART